MSYITAAFDGRKTKHVNYYVCTYICDSKCFLFYQNRENLFLNIENIILLTFSVTLRNTENMSQNKIAKIYLNIFGISKHLNNPVAP